MTHNEYVIQALRHGPKTRRELLSGAYTTIGEGIEVHCRVSDCRKRLAATGETIRSERSPAARRGGRADWRYEIVSVACEQLALLEGAA